MQEEYFIPISNYFTDIFLSNVSCEAVKTYIIIRQNMTFEWKLNTSLKLLTQLVPLRKTYESNMLHLKTSLSYLKEFGCIDYNINFDSTSNHEIFTIVFIDNFESGFERLYLTERIKSLMLINTKRSVVALHMFLCIYRYDKYAQKQLVKNGDSVDVIKMKSSLKCSRRTWKSRLLVSQKLIGDAIDLLVEEKMIVFQNKGIYSKIRRNATGLYRVYYDELDENSDAEKQILSIDPDLMYRLTVSNIEFGNWLGMNENRRYLKLSDDDFIIAIETIDTGLFHHVMKRLRKLPKNMVVNKLRKAMIKLLELNKYSLYTNYCKLMNELGYEVDPTIQNDYF